MRMDRCFFYQVTRSILGKGKIPKDMLRYDTAFVSDEHPGIVAFPVFSVPKQGSLGGRMTTGRWESFLVTLEKMADEVVFDQDLRASLVRDDWHTYRHPSSMSGPVEYASLVRVGMEAYLKAKDTREL